ncbi:GLUG motif-containing protein, partial [Planctomycetota bacterium]
TNSYSTCTVIGNNVVGGLAGYNLTGNISISCSNSTIIGDSSVGGFVGWNDGNIDNSYSTGMVTGNEYVGGFAGGNSDNIIMSYSTDEVAGNEKVGGLVGSNWGSIEFSFWNIENSGQTTSNGGTGKSTAEMQTAITFLDASWDLIGETDNGTEDIWWISEGLHYPRLQWQYGWAFSPYPLNDAVNVPQPLTLSWFLGGSGLYHDVYFGEDREAVANATIENQEIYRRRQEPEMTTYNLDTLELEKTYYWRIDEINQIDPNSQSKGDVWCFTTANFIVVDDFESYDMVDNPIWYTWLDGLGYGDPSKPPFIGGNGTGSAVGNDFQWPEETIVHGDKQSMLYLYDNNKPEYFKYSEAEKTLSYLRTWIEEDVTKLSLWFRGGFSNDPELMYVAIANMTGLPAVIYRDDPNAVRVDIWTEWVIPLQQFADQGIDLTDVDRIAIGFGTRGNMTIPGGRGKMYFDDIRLYRSTPAASNDLEVNIP